MSSIRESSGHKVEPSFRVYPTQSSVRRRHDRDQRPPFKPNSRGAPQNKKKQRESEEGELDTYI